MAELPPQDNPFDFAAHEQASVAAYLKQYQYWADVAGATGRIIEQAIRQREIRTLSVQFRAKDPTSFGRKAAKPSDNDPSKPKYLKPLEQITDLSATRIITYFPRTIDEIDRLLLEEFDVLERSDKAKDLHAEEKFGYQSVHYLVRLSRTRSELAEYQRFAGATTEIQVRTVLQHAWAEIEHDIQYKSASSIPRDIRRRFMALAGMLEIADREFQAIQDDDTTLNLAAIQLIEQGKLGEVEVTPKALRLYLDRRLGPDGRMTDFSYEWTVKHLKRLGFRTLEQVEICISKYDPDKLNAVLSRTRQGQLTRFENLLLASMGEKYIERNRFAGEDWYGPFPRSQLQKLAEAGMPPTGYDPLA
jgi:ppGpp synthetase/RelA/SpoT-type nucleotidyltranferase